jgi:hypothetical protein
MNANDLFKAVTELDLDPIKIKLMHVESGEGWSLEKANAVEKEYRRFLSLMKLFPDEDIAPVMDVDIFWHYHILDTMKYAADCELVFGHFKHHFPYIGLRGEEDERFRVNSGERMRTLYEATFGEDYPTVIGESANYGLNAGLRADVAFSASPHIKTAFSASPHVSTAFSASPHIKTAFSASPHQALSAQMTRPKLPAATLPAAN